MLSVSAILHAVADEYTGNIKDLHIKICIGQDVESSVSNGFEAYQLVGDLPNFSFEDIDTSCELFKKRLSIPLIISPMTGGGKESLRINKNLAEAAQRSSIAMAVGSQAIMLKHPETVSSFYVRDVAPDILLFANLGLVHLNYWLDVQGCLKAVESIEADGLIFYLNPLQEVFQKGGMRNFEGLLDKLEGLCETFPYPVIVKEVGFGLSTSILMELKETGISAVDVGGRGGTDWARVESFLNKGSRSRLFDEFGISTSEGLRAAVEIMPKKVSVFASGGIRTGVDMAKAFAMGAKCIGMGLPFLRWAYQSADKVVEAVHKLYEELRISMWYAGAKDVEGLSGKIEEK